MFHPSLFHARLSGLCKSKNTSITRFTTDVLDISSSAATNWKNGSYPSSEVIYAAAEYFGVSTDYLFGLSDTPERSTPSITPEEVDLLNNLRAANPNARRIILASMQAGLAASDASKEETNAEPSLDVSVLGLAAAGSPLFSPNDPSDTISVPVKYLGSSYENHDFFAIEIRGDSMEPDIPEGSYVIVKADAKPESGDLALVAVESTGPDPEYMVKKVILHTDRVELVSFNEAYPRRVIHLSKVMSIQKVVHVIPNE